MPINCDLPDAMVDRMRRAPIHAILFDLGTAGRDAGLLNSRQFKKVIAYVIEMADGRDRREIWSGRSATTRPIPKLRVVLQDCFGVYVDLHWFKLNKTTNASRLPLTGLFPRMGASLSRVSPEDFGQMILALVSTSPDAKLIRMFNSTSGKIKGMGLELFSRLAYAFRPDLYFLSPGEWAETSGFDRFIGDDLRKYCAMCRGIRALCDRLKIDEDVRAMVFDRAMNQPTPYEPLVKALNQAVGPVLTRTCLIGPMDAFEPPKSDDGRSALPLEFAGTAIRARRGDKRLRGELVRAYRSRCALTGDCPVELLEVAYLVPFPSGDVNAFDNAMLLRSDLHTLWDLNLLGIDPDDMQVRVADRLVGTVYEKLDGRAVPPRADGSKLDCANLGERWQNFVAAHDPDRRTKPPRSEATRHGRDLSSTSARRHDHPDSANGETSPEPHRMAPAVPLGATDS